MCSVVRWEQAIALNGFTACLPAGSLRMHELEHSANDSGSLGVQPQPDLIMNGYGVSPLPVGSNNAGSLIWNSLQEGDHTLDVILSN